ncbi:hypothetical protein EJ03DRAFT_121703 [Teratosphaeria nubilosa]|uniref:Uncharacterized protein n=1 Tax=Teratosphaeria nubilosa TaxID=161662 RepID=A0A6G1L680_9PEZI|nr:hypothetical protein EJ03DRAFT_121703 [Teratosphaeria nubilosa]
MVPPKKCWKDERVVEAWADCYSVRTAWHVPSGSQPHSTLRLETYFKVCAAVPSCCEKRAATTRLCGPLPEAHACRHASCRHACLCIMFSRVPDVFAFFYFVVCPGVVASTSMPGGHRLANAPLLASVVVELEELHYPTRLC